MISEEQGRKLITEEAITWLNTPFHDKAMVKGAGVDCGYFPYAVYKSCGLIPKEFEMPDYSPQFFAHRDEEIFLDSFKEASFTEIELSSFKPGDIVITKVGRVYAHSAILLIWPDIIHASSDAQKVKVDSIEMQRLFSGNSPKKYFSQWPEF